jgi:hypothetical protein
VIGGEDGDDRVGRAPRRKGAATATAGPESRRVGSSTISAVRPISAICSATRKR